MFEKNIRDSFVVKIASLISALVLFAGVVPGIAFASQSITNIDLNGSNSTTIAPAASITVLVTVSLSNGDSWRGTEYRFESGNYTCVDTADHTDTNPNGSQSFTETFSVNAPASNGTYDFDIRVRENAGCTGDQVSGSLNNGVIVSSPAEITTSTATVNGGSITTVLPGATINAHVFGLLQDGTSQNAEWEGTQWLIATTLDSMSCANTDDMDDSVSGIDTDDVTFNITAPGIAGTYNAYFQITENDNCSGDTGGVLTLTNAVIVENPTPDPTLEELCEEAGNTWIEGGCYTDEETCEVIDGGFWNGSDCDDIEVCDGGVTYNETTNECEEPEVEEDIDLCPEPGLQNQLPCVSIVVDTDEDGVADETDNCDSAANADQTDTDNDGIGDVCDSNEGEEENENPAPETSSDDTLKKGGGLNKACNNSEDDDSDGLYDMNDPDCENTSDRSEAPDAGIGGTSEAGDVLGASTSCSAVLTSYIGLNGLMSDPEAVKVLQAFLNKELGLSLDVNGKYDAATIEAVKAFQAKYSHDVLSPWGISDATGIVYKTTQRMINKISCPSLDIPMPVLE